MGNVVNMFELPDSVVLTTAQKAIEAVKKRIKENPVLTFRKLSLVHGVVPSTDGNFASHTHVYCRACDNVFPGNPAKVTVCPHCGSENKRYFEWARTWVLRDFASSVLQVARQRRSEDKAEPVNPAAESHAFVAAA